jgi:hypothetical protein
MDVLFKESGFKRGRLGQLWRNLRQSDLLLTGCGKQRGAPSTAEVEGRLRSGAHGLGRVFSSAKGPGGFGAGKAQETTPMLLTFRIFFNQAQPGGNPAGDSEAFALAHKEDGAVWSPYLDLPPEYGKQGTLRRT